MLSIKLLDQGLCALSQAARQTSQVHEGSPPNKQLSPELYSLLQQMPNKYLTDVQIEYVSHLASWFSTQQILGECPTRLYDPDLFWP